MSENEISVLSVRQPYADCIVCGEKTIELRTWAPSKNNFGKIYIHAGKQPHKNKSSMNTDGCVFGAIIGHVDLVDVIPMDYGLFSYYSDKHLCDPELFADNMCGWVLENATILDAPIPCAGKLRIFKMQESVLE